MNTIVMGQAQLKRTYINMWNRCYNDHIHEIKPWYRECTICDEWYSIPRKGEDHSGMHAFNDWINDGNFYMIEGEPTVQLDHDILVKGNKIYSPETCVFAPKSINSMFGGFAKTSDNGLPQGVIHGPHGKFKTSLQCIHDVFDTPEEAHAVWAEHQKAKIINVADRYYGKIPMKLYDAMLNWQFNIAD